MSQSLRNEKEESRPLVADGSKLKSVVNENTTSVEVVRQDQLLRNIEEVTRILSRYSFPSRKEPVLRHTVCGLISIRTITESMEYAINNPDEDTPGSGHARWGYLKEEGRAK